MRHRVAELSDQGAVADAWYALAEEQRQFGSRIDPDRSRSAVASHLATLIVDEQVIVAEAEGDTVGMVAFDIHDDALSRTEAVGIIEFLYVDPDHRGRGVGRALLDRAEDALSDAGVDVIDIEALVDNEGAIAFYEAAGYDHHRVRVSKRIDEGE